MALFKDTWPLFLDAFNKQRELKRKREQFDKLTNQPLNYQIIEDIVKAATDQAPGFYSRLLFKDGAIWEFGIKENTKPAPRQPDEKF